MLAKCYWKMHKTDPEQLDSKDNQSVVTTEVVLSTLKTAVQVAHDARKSKSSEPILEPHYKMASILHKMVMRGDLPSTRAAEILSKQPLGVQVIAAS